MTTLEQALQDARESWKPGLKEAPTRKFTIDPVLRALGWPDKPDLINVEESVGKGSVDYALYAHGKSRQQSPSLYIEAKRPGKDTDGVVQAVDYAHENGGVPLVVITDGKNWHFYLTHKPGRRSDNYAERRALTIKLDDEQRIAELLPTVLERDAVADGTAMAKLDELHGYEMAKGQFRPAWSHLLESHDFAESVAKLLTAELERFDIEPLHDDALDFVKKQLTKEPVPVPPVNGDNKDEHTGKRKKVTGVLGLEDVGIECHGVPDTIRKLLNWAVDTEPDFMIQLREKRRARRPNSPDSIHETQPEKDKQRYRQIGGFWIRTEGGKNELPALIQDCREITRKHIHYTGAHTPS